MSEKTPNYVLTEAYQFSMGSYGSDMKTLPSGSFVRPIKVDYLPKHVLEDVRWKYVDQKTHTFCYTYYGIIPIPKDILRES